MNPLFFARHLRSMILLLLMAWLFQPATVRCEEIIVSAAASLTNAMEAVGRKFQQLHPDVQVVFNFAASGALLQQMVYGAPVDIFASANQSFMDRAQDQLLIRPATRRDFVRNTLVLAVPAQSKTMIKSLADLADGSTLRIAIGNPDTVPAGRYARQALQRNGLWEALHQRLILATSVRQVLDYLRRGEIDAGLVYRTDVFSAGGDVRSLTAVEKTDPIVYCVAITAMCRHNTAAESFITFLLSDQGQAVLSTFGFERT